MDGYACDRSNLYRAMDVSVRCCAHRRSNYGDEATPHAHWSDGNPTVLFAGEAPYLIVDINDAWVRGFSRVEIIGKPMTLIQGPAT